MDQFPEDLGSSRLLHPVEGHVGLHVGLHIGRLGWIGDRGEGCRGEPARLDHEPAHEWISKVPSSCTDNLSPGSSQTAESRSTMIAAPSIS